MVALGILVLVGVAIWFGVSGGNGKLFLDQAAGTVRHGERLPICGVSTPRLDTVVMFAIRSSGAVSSAAGT